MSEPSRVVWHEVAATTWPTAELARASRRAHAHLGAGDGAVARQRRRLRHADVLDWYGRFADGPAGRARRRGHRHPRRAERPAAAHRPRPLRARPARLAATVRERSGGRTRLLLQIIDFLAIRRRPEKAKYFARFLQLTPRHRAPCANASAPPRPPTTRCARRSPRCDDDTLRTMLTAARVRDYAFGAREEVNDLHLPHMRELPRVLPGLFADAAGARARPGRLRRRRAALRARLHDGVVPLATNVRDDGYGGSPAARLRLPLEVFAAVRARVGARLLRRRRFLGDEVIAGGSRIDDAVRYTRSRSRAPARLPVDQQGRQVRRREAAERRRGRLSLHRSVRPRVHADGAQRRARAVRPQRAARRGDPRAVRAAGHTRRSSPPAASATSRRPRRSCSDGTPTSSPPRARASPIRTGGRSCAARPRRRGAALQVHQLLRRPRPEAQGGHLPAVGSRLPTRRRAFSDGACSAQRHAARRQAAGCCRG
jgi:hypothetical protein